MCVRNCWYVAGWERELAPDALMSRTIMNEAIVLFRRSDGTVAALEDRCCHRSAPLSLGKREGDTLRCGYHGLRYDGSGACVEIPGQAHIPATARVRSYPSIARRGLQSVIIPHDVGPVLIRPVMADLAAIGASLQHQASLAQALPIALRFARGYRLGFGRHAVHGCIPLFPLTYAP